MRFLNWIAKFSMILSAAGTINLITVTNANAQSEAILMMIKINTDSILSSLNSLPGVLQKISQATMDNSWNKTDTATMYSYVTGNYANLINQLITDNTKQNDKTLQLQLTSDLLGQPTSYFTGNPAPVLNLLPNLNEITYTTFLNAPPVTNPNTGTDPAYGYLKNVSGINFLHEAPLRSFKGDKTSILNYYNYYNTVRSIESFNGYVLSNQLVDNNKSSTIYNQILQDASKPTWIEQIAGQNIATVIRQILLFQSQNFILLTQLLQTQKQMLTAQVMTNTLLILLNKGNEPIILSKAKTAS